MTKDIFRRLSYVKNKNRDSPFDCLCLCIDWLYDLEFDMNLIDRLRRSYVDHGTNYVQEAADTIERLTADKWSTEETNAELGRKVDRLTAERDALKSALQLIKANTNTLDWPDDINAAIQGAGK